MRLGHVLFDLSVNHLEQQWGKKVCWGYATKRVLGKRAVRRELYMALRGLRDWAITWQLKVQIKFKVMHAGKTSLKFTYEMMVSELLIITQKWDLWTIIDFSTKPSPQCSANQIKDYHERNSKQTEKRTSLDHCANSQFTSTLNSACNPGPLLSKRWPRSGTGSEDGNKDNSWQLVLCLRRLRAFTLGRRCPKDI